jgi:hypothetical protein
MGLAELLRRRGDRVVLNRATSAPSASSTEGRTEQSPDAPIAHGPSDEAPLRENQRLAREVLRLEAEVRRLEMTLTEQTWRAADRGQQH